MSSSHPPPAGPDEPTWTMGEAARFLNGGGVDFQFDARAVRRMADDPDNQIRAVTRGRRGWRRALASTVRAERARLLAAAGRADPDSPAPGYGGGHSPGR